MSAKHTPGPWVAETNARRGSWVAGRNGEWAALSCGNTNETAAANARLIAAAPELLEALKAAHDYLAGNGWEGDPRMAPIVAAITKATGGKP